MLSDDRPPQREDEFGALLRRWRQHAGLSQEALAQRAGLSVRTVRNLERGQVRALPTTVRLLREALALDPRARDQFDDAATRSRGSRGPAAAAALAGMAVTPAQLPADVAGFSGRAEHLRRLDALLAGEHGGPARAVVIGVITGTAGVGKTALAVHWSHRVAERFPDGQLFVDLNGFAPGPPVSPVQALAQLLGALGVDASTVPVEVDQAAALYRSLLAGRRALLVLDSARDAAQVRPLLPGDPGCMVVVTSRERLGGLVASHGAQRLTLDELAPEEAVSLLARILGRERVQAEPAVAAELARACGFLPLALRIAAAKLSCHPGQSIADQVVELHARGRLEALAVEGDPQAAVRAAFDCSYATLGAEAQRLFRLLGLVPGPDFTAEGAAALAAVTPERAGTLLDRLAGGHLVEPRGAGRFGFHDLLRLYARERAADDGEPERRRALGRLLDWYLRRADAAHRLLYPEMLRAPAATPAAAPPGDRFDGHAAALAWLDAERAGLMAAVRHAAEHGPRPAAWLLADALRGYFWKHRHMADWLALVHGALRAAEAEGDLRARAATQRNLGLTYQRLGDYQQAAERLAGALRLARQAGWAEGEAATFSALGMAFTELGQLQEAADSLLQSWSLWRLNGDQAGQAVALTNLACTEQKMGEPQRAIGHATQALALHRSVGSRSGQAVTLQILGEAQRDLGRLERAQAHVTEALALARGLGNHYDEAINLRTLAVIRRDAGQLAAALELAEAAVALAGELGNPHIEADALNTLGSVQEALAALEDRGAAAAGQARAPLDGL